MQLSINEIKNKALEKNYDKLNSMQQKAVFTVNGPLLILAGAGSGKTTVLVNRIAHILAFGNAYNEDFDGKNFSDDDILFLKDFASGKTDDVSYLRSLISSQVVNAWNVLAITFTNKAANELKDRLQSLLGEEGSKVNAGTFHSICVRILRREITSLGYTSSFTIYDTDDSVRVIKDCIKDLGISDKMFPPKSCLNEISRQKDRMIEPDELIAMAEADFRLKTIANVYKLYQSRLKNANALDFDDIIMLTVKIFEQDDEVLRHYQNLYKYILVDEYQDTNELQYRLVSLLSKRHNNLCVVGDDDQSIYKFRGATIENILSFERQFKNAVVIRLEQNYRSTQNILDGANKVIANNLGRKGKSLWTDNGKGEKITVFRANNDSEECAFITDTIEKNVQQGLKLSDHAILYRMNALSNGIERQLIRSGIDYRIVGGKKFFDRKEIKDMTAYLSVINNPADSVRLKRIVNEPKRGIGESSVKNVEAISLQTGLSMSDVMKDADNFALISKKASALQGFVQMIDELRDLSLSIPLDELLDELLDKTGYRLSLQAQGVEGKVRLENIEELKSNMVKYSEENPDGSLSGFLEEIALYTDLDSMNESDDRVTLMTLHSAKGLEFECVFIMGTEDNIFPSYLSKQSEEELEEERRLAYVGITRAKKKLYITSSAERMLFGNTSRNLPSVFIKELPEEVIDMKDNTVNTYHSQKVNGFAPRNTYAAEHSSVGVSAQKQQAKIDYAPGDTVTHKIFGRGLVLSMQPMANDTLVEIAFEKVGTKKIMANFAKLTKV